MENEECSSQVDEKTKEYYEEKARVDKERYLKEKAESVSKCLLFVLDENPVERCRERRNEVTFAENMGGRGGIKVKNDMQCKNKYTQEIPLERRQARLIESLPASQAAARADFFVSISWIASDAAAVG